MIFLEIFKTIESLKIISSSFTENWSSLSCSGKFEGIDKSVFKDLNREFKNENIQTSLRFQIENEVYDIDDFLEDIQPGDKWVVNINKSVIIQNKIGNSYHTNFFYSKSDFLLWSSKTNPFDKNHPFNQCAPIKIIVKDLEFSFGGINVLVCNQNDATTTFDKLDYKLPKHQDVLDLVHVISIKTHCINPENHLITFGKVDNYSKGLFKNSSIVLLSCIINEIHEDDKIIIRGVRRLDLNFCGVEDICIGHDYNELLLNAVQWVYSEKEKRELRLKLLLERITLDIDLKMPFITGLQFVIKDSLQQAKERYSFIVYERKDLYQKELKELLKDLKAISDLYSGKVRILLSNLLRDVLAAFLLVGITLFSKSAEIEKLISSNLINYVFKAFAGYFLLSAIFQFVVDFFDIIRSENEFSYWKNVSKEYMTQSEFNEHKSKTLDLRSSGSKILYVIVIVCYLVVAFICWNFICLWGKLIN